MMSLKTICELHWIFRDQRWNSFNTHFLSYTIIRHAYCKSYKKYQNFKFCTNYASCVTPRGSKWGRKWIFWFFFLSWKLGPMFRDFLQKTDPLWRHFPVCLNMWVPRATALNYTTLFCWMVWKKRKEKRRKKKKPHSVKEINPSIKLGGLTTKNKTKQNKNKNLYSLDLKLGRQIWI